MRQSSKKVTDILEELHKVKSDDPDMIAKLNVIARKVAEVQGKMTAAPRKHTDNFSTADPMEELGCEGCQ
jgi:hypothetical protein